ncbi:TPA: 50S ribosomal protein L17 [bacterium]|nr:MAG: 50S ribosomal protein L17 [Candidatus Hydrogenedentes bacterium CG1_02_42_14]PIU48002.1 MAG: 50S ribosomal protein L17 [Candidatus Hydrogenedentes bacterium CG07_land_8_20_14_0_80_42_17]HBW46646.1 50S ribosomal protein L17 [bacterium]
MRHRVRGNNLGRMGSERKALLKGMAIDLIIHGKIRTTDAKAKALRPYVERLVTIARKDTLSNRRLIASRLNNPNGVKVLFKTIAPRYAERKGGYLRLIKISGFQRGDATRLSELQWV